MSNADEIRWQQRFENFTKALGQLEAACQKGEYSDLERAGLVQMFEFTFELGWKTLKDLQFYEGFTDNTPREVIRRAFQVDYLTEADTELWLDALVKRNILSHTYNENTAREAERLIVGLYHPMLRRLFDVLEKKRKR